MLIRGDARALPLRDACVQCVITSPPYFGMRDYGTGTWVGGDPACGHVEKTIRTREGLAAWSAVHASGGGHKVPTNLQFREACPCGARRVDAQIGLEATPDAYVHSIVAVFREVWRVLRDDGTLWLNVGDTYNTGTTAESKPSQDTDVGYWQHADRIGRPRVNWAGLKTKDLCGIPWLLAFALRADGWYLRADIIWSKPNPMPESTTDRPTKAHEYVFLLTKSARYRYDAAAIAEPSVFGAHHAKYQGTYIRHKVEAMQVGGATNGEQYQEGLRRPAVHPLTRNRRDVWTVPTQSYSDAHFATMPEALVEPCVLAGCPLGGLVLDPFVGSGTVISVASRLGRSAVGVDLTYQDLAATRTAQRGLRFGSEALHAK